MALRWPAAGEPGGAAQFLFDAQQLVVFADAVGAARRSGLDLAGRCPHRQVRDRRVLGFAGAVRDDRAVVGVAGHLHRVERLRDRADLIELDQQCVADPICDAALQNLGIGHEHVVADELHRAPSSRVSSCQPSQSPSATPSSIEMIG